MKYLWLAGAILSEVFATSSLKASEGFTHLWSSLAVIAGYGVAFYCMSQTLKSLPLGIVYAIWSGVGTTLIAIVGRVLFRQRLDLPALIGMAFIVVGVAIMNLFSRSSAH